VIDEGRRQTVQKRYARDAEYVDQRSDDLDAARVLESKQSLELIKAAIAGLDERSREFLLMRRIDGLSSAEIARRHGCSPTLVKSIIARALLVCHRALADSE